MSVAADLSLHGVGSDSDGFAAGGVEGLRHRVILGAATFEGDGQGGGGLRIGLRHGVEDLVAEHGGVEPGLRDGILGGTQHGSVECGAEVVGIIGEPIDRGLGERVACREVGHLNGGVSSVSVFDALLRRRGAHQVCRGS